MSEKAKLDGFVTTCFDNLLRHTVSAVVPASCGVALAATVGEALLPAATPVIWLFHVLIGDGIQTNEAAAQNLGRACK